MLETLISSRIRRTLLEYILGHPADRFYLRGLAKELALPVSPLRRELKRLEHAGLLRTDQEANILFYHVNTICPMFTQLQQASQRIEAPSPATAPERVRSAEFGVRSERHSELHIPNSALGRFRIPHSTLGWWRSPLSTPALMGATAVGMALMLVMAGLFYFAMTEKRFASQLATRKASVTVVTPAAEASGTMRGSRWQIVPGSFGGFSSGASNESY